MRAKFRGQGARAIVATAAQLRVQSSWDLETHTSAEVLRGLARRRNAMATEAKAHEAAIGAIVREWRADLLDQFGVGPIVAATVLCAWSHAGRCRNEGAFAKLAGIAPIEASTGITNRHRLNPFGDRQLNKAIHIVVLHRLRHDPATIVYAERRRAQGKTDREIRRCLKRYVFRQRSNNLLTDNRRVISADARRYSGAPVLRCCGRRAARVPSWTGTWGVGAWPGTR